MSRRKLPLESTDWHPIEQVLEQHSQRVGPELTKQDFHEALKPPGRLRVMVRRADGSRELAPASAWEDDLSISMRFRIMPNEKPFVREAGLCVYSRKLRKRPPECWFFVWKPDYEEAFGSGPVARPSETVQLGPAARRPETVQLPQRRRGPPPKLDQWFPICGEIARRCIDPKTGRLRVPKNESALARDVLQWCEDRDLGQPAESDMREAVRRVCAALRPAQK